MSHHWLSLIMTFIVLFLVACMPTVNPPFATVVPTVAEVTMEMVPPEVTPTSPVPPSTPGKVPEKPVFLYPDAQDGSEVSWSQAVAMILNGEAKRILQTHSLKVYLTLKDGRTLVTVQPAIDEVFKIIEQCGENCRGVLIATE